MQYYIMLIFAAVLLAGDFVIQKKFQSRTDGSLCDCLMFSFIFRIGRAQLAEISAHARHKSGRYRLYYRNRLDGSMVLLA